MVAHTAILAGQIIAVGLVLRVVAGVPEQWGLVLGGCVATAYFVMGGLRSAAWVNSLQVVVKVAGFAIAVPWMLRAGGGWASLAAAAPDAQAVPGGGTGPAAIAQMVLMLAPAFMVSPGLVQKLFGARDESAVRTGVGLQGAALLGFAFLPVLLGMIARVHFPDLDDPGLALIRLLGEAAPTWLGALMLAAVFSAEISSADAVLFMITTLHGAGRDRAAVRRAAGGRGATRLGTTVGCGRRPRGHPSGGVVPVDPVGARLLLQSADDHPVRAVAGGIVLRRRPGQATALAAMGFSLAAAGLSLLVPDALGGWLGPVPSGIAASAAVFLARGVLRSRIDGPAGSPGR